jgi:hypothetical protein
VLCTSYVGAAGMLVYIHGKFTMGKLKAYLLSHFSFLTKKNKKKPARSFKLTFRCIDYVFLLHNSRFGAFVDRIYPIGFEIKDTTDTVRSVSYLDLHSEINSEGRLRMKNVFCFKLLKSVSNTRSTYKISVQSLCTKRLQIPKE